MIRVGDKVRFEGQFLKQSGIADDWSYAKGTVLELSYSTVHNLNREPEDRILVTVAWDGPRKAELPLKIDSRKLHIVGGKHETR